MRRILLALIIITLITHGSFVHGDIVKSKSDHGNKTLIQITGRFSYQLITQNSNYSIYLPEGTYTIEATSLGIENQAVAKAKENVQIGAEDQRIDLLLKPESNEFLTYGLGIAGIITLGIGIWFLGQKNTKINTQNQRSNPAEEIIEETEIAKTQPKPAELDEDAKKVLVLLENMEGRTTQKELREAIGFSDAKLSLILSELENMNLIKKFKRGRGNIIRKISTKQTDIEQ
ncbi:hypothetical protein HY990_05730 [Candidatus Micrarchaeota archaeon]|nr:hypothetical protein [Candidatus Micrarchaeota archaeon]